MCCFISNQHFFEENMLITVCTEFNNEEKIFETKEQSAMYLLEKKEKKRKTQRKSRIFQISRQKTINEDKAPHYYKSNESQAQKLPE